MLALMGKVLVLGVFGMAHCFKGECNCEDQWQGKWKRVSQE
jgi:hypothetical protein